MRNESFLIFQKHLSKKEHLQAYLYFFFYIIYLNLGKYSYEYTYPFTKELEKD